MIASDPSNPSQPPRYALRVFRLKEGQGCHVRTLSVAYGGLFTHFRKQRSYYCDPAGCNDPDHKKGRFWKGYFGGEVYDPTLELWAPVVFEMTEGVELDFRGKYKRGQVWSVTRADITGKGKPPVRAELVEEFDEADFPPAFDITGCLRSLYHVESLCLATKNPLPDRVIVTHSAGAPPPGVDTRRAEAPADNGCSQADWRRMLAEAEEKRRRQA